VHPDTNEEFLGLDVGEARIGVARGASQARLAQPLKTVSAGDALAEIAALAEKYQVSGVVVGLPRNLDGADTGQTNAVRLWARSAQAKINKPFYWQDEALTSVAADRYPESDAGRDAAAASVILQDFLDTPAGERVRC
jgi:putative Holliday junction resolvase